MKDSGQMRKVLDNGSIRLVDSMGGDLSVVRSARVSYNAAWRAGSDKNSDSRLIHYLYKNDHSTPFESVVFTFDVKAPIMVFRQWHRHRTQSYNEVSARYAVLPNEFYTPHVYNIGKQSETNKQARNVLTRGQFHLLSHDERNEIFCIQNEIFEHCTLSFKTYEHLIEKKVPREIARGVLPVFTYSQMFTTMNLNNLFKFLHERLHYRAQWEIRQYALAILDLITPIVPVCVEAFKEKFISSREEYPDIDF